MSAHPAPRATRAIRAETAGSSGLALGPNQRGKGGGEVEASIPVMQWPTSASEEGSAGEHGASLPRRYDGQAFVRSWRQGLLDTGVGQSTVSKAYRLLRAVLNTAADGEVISRNPRRIGAPRWTGPRSGRSEPWTKSWASRKP